MIKDLFPSPSMVRAEEATHLGSYVDFLATRLQIQGYATSTIGAHLRGVLAFVSWWLRGLNPTRSMSRHSNYISMLSNRGKNLIPRNGAREL